MTDSSSTQRLLAVRAPLHAGLSPDGSLLTLTTVRIPEGSEEEIVELTVVEVRSGVETTLPSAAPGDRVGQWAPDGERVAFLTDRNGETSLAVAELASSRADVFTGVERVDGPPVWSPDGSAIVVPCRRGTVVDRTRPYRWKRPFPAADGVGPLEDPPQLRLVDVATGDARWLTDDAWRWATPRWSPDGSKIAATVAADPSDMLGGQCLRVVDLKSTVGSPAVPGGRGVVPVWLPDVRLVVLVVEPHGRPAGSAATLFVISGADVRELPIPDLLGDVFGDCPAELADTYEQVMIAHDDSVVVRVGARGRMGIATVDIDTGEVTQILEGQRACSPVGLADNRLVFTRQAADLFPELAIINIVGHQQGGEQRLVSFAADTTPPAQVRRFTVESAEGWPLDGWFLSPPRTSAPLPTVLVIHGGPHFAYGEAFSLDAQALCAAGFGVLYTNPRGSTGYGDDFAHAVHGDWADGPTRDVLTVVDHAVQSGWADPERLGVTGNSYGGYLSAWLASTTNRFRAAVIENPVIDLLGMYGTSDIGRRFFPAQLGGPPRDNIDVYVAQSPLLQGHRCQTPSLFVVGELDRRCPPAQAWAMHRVLCETGTPSEVLVLPGSTHEGSTYGPPMGRFAHDEALVEWMTRWVTC
ncbi:MAG: S9 family peptidase [Actinomycetia bacterium]|nr:S9 family peptidase [Actinomycetes bacterium]